MEQKKDGLAACGGCTSHDKDTQHQPVQYIVHERDMARMERNNKRWFILCVVMFLAFVISNGLWMYRESQFEDVVTETQEITQDVDSGEGGNAIINDGVHVNGESKADSKNNKD